MVQTLPRTRRRVLCIEDDHECASLIAEELVDCGFEVRIAHNGREGIAAIEKAWPDLVLCDIYLPDISGFEVLKRSTALVPRLKRVPFVFLTALTELDSQIKGRQLGADGYITKPIDFDVLAAIAAGQFPVKSGGIAPIDITGACRLVVG